jgi:hypothetical protein
VQPTAKLHFSPGLTEFPDVAFDSLASNSGYSDSNLYRRNDDVFRGFVHFIRTNLVIKNMLTLGFTVTNTGGKGARSCNCTRKNC